MITNNSIWPNGVQKDDEDYEVFYPLGTNKIQIPEESSEWPSGSKIISPFVYDEDDNLVGFCDTKALITVGSKTTINLPYNHVELNLSSIIEGTLDINAPNSTTNEVRWNKKPSDLLPANYKYVKYLESTATQALNVPVSIDCSASIVSWIGTLENIMGPGGANQHPWGLGTGDYSTGFYRTGLRVTGGKPTTGEYYFNFMQPSTNFDVKSLGTPKVHEIIKVVSDYSEGKIYINDSFKTNFTTITHVIEGDCGLFAHRWNPQLSDGRLHTDWCNSRIQHFSISTNGNIYRYLVPALDETGAPCMFDAISRTSFYNVGTGDFLYPSDYTQHSTTYGLRREKTYAKMTEQGIRRLYNVPSGVDMSKEEYAVENGYKELIESEMPSEGNWTYQWTETDTQLICEWIEIETPLEEI